MARLGNATERAIRRVGLVPFVYGGTPPRVGTTVSNTYLEAMSDLNDCRAIVVVARTWNAQTERNFGVDELTQAVSQGRHGLVYIVADQPNATTPTAPAGIPSTVTVRIIGDAAELEERLAEDLATLMRS